jgi:hypothetical protein
VFLHLVGSAGHVVHSDASRARNVDTLFLMLGWDRYGIHIKCAGTRYAKLMFLYPVGSAGHVVHSCDTPSFTVVATTFYSTSAVQSTLYLGFNSLLKLNLSFEYY